MIMGGGDDHYIHGRKSYTMTVVKSSQKLNAQNFDNDHSQDPNFH